MAFEECQQNSNNVAARNNVMNKKRCEMLKKFSSRYDYDLIHNGEKNDHLRNEINIDNYCLEGLTVLPRMKGRKQVGDGLGHEAPKRGNALLRDSCSGRYFTPQPSGKKQHYRQNNIMNEGLIQPRTSSVLNIPTYNHEEGRRKVGILSSCGVEEQFSKSNYAEKSEVKKKNLKKYIDIINIMMTIRAFIYTATISIMFFITFDFIIYFILFLLTKLSSFS